MVMIVAHTMHDHHKVESCHNHENKHFHDISMTYPASIHDFLGNFHIPRLSMTAIFSRIFRDHMGTLSLYNYSADYQQINFIKVAGYNK